MALETGSHIAELDDTNPPGGDPKSQGDDHLRLIKRCTKGSFPAFVGDTATPKSVTLTEDEINDAALKSAIQTITGAWSLFNDLYLNGRNLADDADIGLIKADANDNAVFGDAARDARMLALALLSVEIGGNAIMNFATAALGSADVADRLGVPHLVGYRNPPYRNMGDVDHATIQADEASTLNFSGATVGRILTVDQLEAETQLDWTNSKSGVALLINAGAGVTLRTYNGTGTRLTGNLQQLGGSVGHLYWISATEVYVWGNGLAVQ